MLLKTNSKKEYHGESDQNIASYLQILYRDVSLRSSTQNSENHPEYQFLIIDDVQKKATCVCVCVCVCVRAWSFSDFPSKSLSLPQQEMTLFLLFPLYAKGKKTNDGQLIENCQVFLIPTF